MKAKAKGAQVILPIFDMPQSGILVKQWKTMHIPALMAGFISPLAGPGSWKLFDGKIAGAMNCIFEIGNMPVPKVPKSVEFYEKYLKKYGKPIEAGHSPAPAYEMIYMLKEAIERAGTLDTEAVILSLEKTDYTGVCGRYRFYPKGHKWAHGLECHRFFLQPSPDSSPDNNWSSTPRGQFHYPLTIWNIHQVSAACYPEYEPAGR